MGVNENASAGKEIGAGDQGMMFGYACNDTPELMPLPICLAHRILHRLTDARFKCEVPWLRPDSKSQVTVEYEDRKPVRIDTVVVSTQHCPEVTQEEIRDYVIKRSSNRYCRPSWSTDRSPTTSTRPAGSRWAAHTGTPGDRRKIIVDTYGGWARHGGGAFSGKDPTKVDRSAAYMARHVAKNIVAAGLADRCEVAVGLRHRRLGPGQRAGRHRGHRPAGRRTALQAGPGVLPADAGRIIRHLDLRRPIYRKTASGGHFGRSEPEFTWEKTDRAAELANAAGMKVGGRR